MVERLKRNGVGELDLVKLNKEIEQYTVMINKLSELPSAPPAEPEPQLEPAAAGPELEPRPAPEENIDPLKLPSESDDQALKEKYIDFYRAGGRVIKVPDQEDVEALVDAGNDGSPNWKIGITQNDFLIPVCHQGMNRSQVMRLALNDVRRELEVSENIANSFNDDYESPWVSRAHGAVTGCDAYQNYEDVNEENFIGYMFDDGSIFNPDYNPDNDNDPQQAPLQRSFYDTFHVKKEPRIGEEMARNLKLKPNQYALNQAEFQQVSKDRTHSHNWFNKWVFDSLTSIKMEPSDQRDASTKGALPPNDTTRRIFFAFERAVGVIIDRLLEVKRIKDMEAERVGYLPEAKPFEDTVIVSLKYDDSMNHGLRHVTGQFLVDELNMAEGTKIDNVQLTPTQVEQLKIFLSEKLNQVHQKSFDMYRSLVYANPRGWNPPAAEVVIEPEIPVQPPAYQPPVQQAPVQQAPVQQGQYQPPVVPQAVVVPQAEKKHIKVLFLDLDHTIIDHLNYDKSIETAILNTEGILHAGKSTLEQQNAGSNPLQAEKQITITSTKMPILLHHCSDNPDIKWFIVSSGDNLRHENSRYQMFRKNFNELKIQFDNDYVNETGAKVEGSVGKKLFIEGVLKKLETGHNKDGSKYIIDKVLFADDDDGHLEAVSRSEWKSSNGNGVKIETVTPFGHTSDGHPGRVIIDEYNGLEVTLLPNQFIDDIANRLGIDRATMERANMDRRFLGQRQGEEAAAPAAAYLPPEPAAYQAPAAAAYQAPVGDHGAKIIQLTAMGFPEIDAHAALTANGGDVSMAADWLFQGYTAPPAPAPPPAPPAQVYNIDAYLAEIRDGSNKKTPEKNYRIMISNRIITLTPKDGKGDKFNYVYNNMIITNPTHKRGWRIGNIPREQKKLEFNGYTGNGEIIGEIKIILAFNTPLEAANFERKLKKIEGLIGGNKRRSKRKNNKRRSRKKNTKRRISNRRVSNRRYTKRRSRRRSTKRRLSRKK